MKYYVNFNNTDLNSLYIITNIERTLLPKMSLDVLDVPTVHGDILNSLKYNNYEVKVSLLVRRNTEDETNQALADLKTLLRTKDVVQVALSPDKFGLGLVSSIDNIDRKTKCDCAVTFTITFPQPYFYSYDLYSFNSTTGEVEAVNDGGESTRPYLVVGFTEDTHFVQIDNSNGEKMLIGKYPQVELEDKKVNDIVLLDDCTTISQWTQKTLNIAPKYGTGGTATITTANKGICLASISSSSTSGTTSSDTSDTTAPATTWSGVALSQNIAQEVDQFQVTAEMTFSSTGTNGDPANKTYNTTFDAENITKPYRVVKSKTLKARCGAGTNYEVITTLKQGKIISAYDIVNGWLHYYYYVNNEKKECYSNASYTTKMTGELPNSKQVKTYVVIVSEEGYTATNIRSSYRHSSTILGTIPVKTYVRCHTYEFTDPNNRNNIYLKMYDSYNGFKGYLNKNNLMEANDVKTGDIPESEYYQYADWKTGQIRLFGFDINGNRLFDIGMCDKYTNIEYTEPEGYIGDQLVLEDNNRPSLTIKPTITNTNDGTFYNTNAYGGARGDWNDCDIIWNIERRKDSSGSYTWGISLSRIKNGSIDFTLKKSNLKDVNFSTAGLGYIGIYLGTHDSMNKCSDMALTNLEIRQFNINTDESLVDINPVYFHKGDTLDIDCNKRTTLLNNVSANHLVDIGSTYPKFDVGTNTLKVSSDSDTVFIGGVFRKIWIGCD